MGEPGWGYVVVAYSIAALVLVFYEVRLWNELRDRPRSRGSKERSQQS